MLTSASTNATAAATVTAVGRSPLRSGTIFARAASFLSSLREGVRGSGSGGVRGWELGGVRGWELGVGSWGWVPARARFRPLRDMRSVHRRAQVARRALWVWCVAYRSDDHDSCCTCGGDLVHVRLVDAADREERLRGDGRCVTDEVEPGGGAARLRGRLPDRAGAQVVGVRRQ